MLLIETCYYSRLYIKRKKCFFFQYSFFSKVVNSGHSATNGEFNCVSWPCKTVFSQLDKIWNENLEYQMRAQARNLWFFGSQELSPESNQRKLNIWSKFWIFRCPLKAFYYIHSTKLWGIIYSYSIQKRQPLSLAILEPFLVIFLPTTL